MVFNCVVVFTHEGSVVVMLLLLLLVLLVLEILDVGTGGQGDGFVKPSS